MTIQILFLVLGLVLTVLGADWLVDGSSSIARKAGISDFVIGLTIVGFGTSCPELVVSLTGAIQGNADISVGNVVGSNIMNTLLILGLTAMIFPVSMTRTNCRRDIPLNLLVIYLFIATGMNFSLLGLGSSDTISRIEGIVYLIVFAIYMFYCFKSGRRMDNEPEGDTPEKVYKLPVAISLTLVGLASLIFGGRLFVDSATALARMLGVSNKFIAITVLAGGTSLPELATCIVAAAKHKEQLALGNILGSNLFNILLILGVSAVVTPLSLSSMDLMDIAVLMLSGVLLWIWTYTGRRDTIDRWEGLIFAMSYIGYIIYLFSRI